MTFNLNNTIFKYNLKLTSIIRKMKKQLMTLFSLFFLLTVSTFAINEDGKVKIQNAGAKIQLYRHSLQNELQNTLDELHKSSFKSVGQNQKAQMLEQMIKIAENASTSINNEFEKSKLTPTEKSEIKSKWSNPPEEVLKGSEMNEILYNINNWSTQKQSIEKSIIKAQKTIESELEKSS